MTQQQPVRIVGAGIGGLVLGRCLLKHGVPVALYERRPIPKNPWKDPRHRHAYGITLHADAYRPLLPILGLGERTFRRRVAVDAAVGGTGNIDPKLLVHPGKVMDSVSCFRAHRGKLVRLLLGKGEGRNLGVQWQTTLEKVEETSEPGIAALYLRQRKAQELKVKLKGVGCVIGADGQHSITRKSLFSSTESTPLKVLPYVVFHGNRRVERVVFDSIYGPAMRGSNVNELRQGDVVLNVSIDEHQGGEGGPVSVGWTYSRPAKEKGSADLLHKPDRPPWGAADIPEAFFEEIEALQGQGQGLEQQPLFKEVFDAEKLRQDRGVRHWLMRTALVSRQDLHALAEKGVFLIGDTIHVEPILGGEGANRAIVDGVELAECIARNGGPSGISAWYDARYPEWENGIGRSERTIAEMHGIV